MPRFLLILALCSLAIPAIGQSPPRNRPGLVPWPTRLTIGSGATVMPQELAVIPTGRDKKAEDVARVFAADLRELRFSPVVEYELSNVRPRIVLEISNDPAVASAIDNNGYMLDINDSITITARTDDGLFWGTRTLLQLLSEGPRAWVTNMVIVDNPKFGFRSCHVDVARQFHSIDFHRKMIKKLAQYKVNVYHIHFSDDQSYTLPSDAFPSLPTPGRHYTRQELKDLVMLAERYHVTIVPEIEMPGHNSYLCGHLPDVLCKGKKEGWMTCAGSQKSYAALEKLISETMEIFPGPYFHIGADEVDVESWKDCPDCQAMKAKEGLADNEALYNYFINRMNRFVKSKGRKTIVWEGFKVGKKPIIDKNVLVEMFDCSYSLPGEVAKAGYDIVNTSWVPIYIVGRKASTPEAIAEWNPLYFGGGHPPKLLKDLIKIEPTKRLKGAGMCSWENEEFAQDGLLFGTGKKLEWYADPAPRVPVFAERAWGSKTTPEDLLARVKLLTSP